MRPNNGVIRARAHTIISVMLQPYDAESLNEKSKHKFMVQTAFAPQDVPESELDLDTFWRGTPASAISDAKLRVVFEQEPTNPSANLDFVSNVSNSASAAYDTAINSTASSSSQVVNKGENSPLPPASLPSSSVSSTAMDTSISSNTSNSSHQPQQQQQQQSQLSQLPQQQQPQSGRSHQSAHANEAGEEINFLRHELKRLKQENMQLKEDGMRQRYKSAGGQNNESSSSELLYAQAKLSGRSDLIASQDLTALLVNPNVIALVVVAFVIGMVISKIVF